MDNKQLINVIPFGMCKSLANPTVAAATAAAMGALTPMPCMPPALTPWVPGAPKILIGNMPALTESSKCFCPFGGVISMKNSGQVKVDDG